MGNAYEIYALRYATMSPRTPHLNFLLPDPHETTAQDLDYFVWLIRGHGRDILVDTGFNAEEAKLRARKLTLNPVDALAAFGVKAEDIWDVVVTHLHYDHAGNLDRFANAKFHLQDREMSYATGRCMCNGMLRHPFAVEHVTQMVRHVYGERVVFHSGDGEVAPGVIVADGDFVIVHGRFSGLGRPANWIAVDIVRIEDGVLVEHWDVIQDEATQEQSKSGRPMFGDSFPK